MRVASEIKYEVTNGLPGGLWLSNIGGPPVTFHRRLSNLDIDYAS